LKVVDGRILFQAGPCGEAAVTNTDTIHFIGLSADVVIYEEYIDLSGTVACPVPHSCHERGDQGGNGNHSEPGYPQGGLTRACCIGRVRAPG
jgi:hypothetical protein